MRRKEEKEDLMGEAHPILLEVRKPETEHTSNWGAISVYFVATERKNGTNNGFGKPKYGGARLELGPHCGLGASGLPHIYTVVLV